MANQLPLDFRLRDEAVLERFVIGENAELLQQLGQLNNQPDELLMFYINGSSGSGKTHLLQALAHQNEHAMYIPFSLISKPQAELMEGLEQFPLVCLDDIDSLVEQNEMQVVLFSFLKAAKEKAVSVVMSSGKSIEDAGFQLPDLISRLQGCMKYQLQPLNDEFKRQYLKEDFKRRGLQVGNDVIDWIMSHHSRDMNSLNELLNELDKASLSEQRRLTVPFVKSAIN